MRNPSPNQLGFFDAPRMSMHESIRLSLESLRAYLPRHRHLVVMFSGGKDSTAMLSFVLWAILTGQVPRTESVTVILADTRLELPPLLLAAMRLLEEAREKGAEGGLHVETRIVVAPLDERILVYMLGRGVPPATNMTMRWCTRLAKGDPAKAALEEILGARGDVLILTGLREGESAVRDRRIATVCSSKGGECGAGLYQRTGEKLNAATLAPLLHWRACHIWEWNGGWAPREEFGGFSTRLVATVYGVDSPDEKDLLEAVDDTARTGCTGCFCVEVDRASARVVRLPGWGHLGPIMELKAVWTRLRRHDVRLRQPGGERRKDGQLAAKQHRIGPIIMPARLAALDALLDIQRRVNVAAAALGRPGLDILNGAEEGRIRELIALDTWPAKWTGKEPLATDPFEEGGQLNFLIEDDDGEEVDASDTLVTLGVRRG